MRLNMPNVTNVLTHNGAPGFSGKPIDQLRRTVMSCMLWEDNFYEDGIAVHDRIKDLVPKCDFTAVADIAQDAKLKYKLRHVPLLLIRELLRHPEKSKRPLFYHLIANLIMRADELAEILAIYWKEGRKPIPAALKKGLALAFTEFDEYQLAKYNRDNAIKLRDVLFLCHAKPKDEIQADLWKRLVEDKLQVPDTWEVALSAGENKKETFERLLSERKLGYLALLRNLRNMIQANVDHQMVRMALLNPFKGILPFQFLAAIEHAPAFAQELNQAMLAAIDKSEMLMGRTIILIDCSGSMTEKLSKKGTMSRNDAAIGLAILARELCEKPRILCFADQMQEVPAWNGLALKDAVCKAALHIGGGTNLGTCVNWIAAHMELERIIVITDEQSNNAINANFSPNVKRYILNVGCYQNGVATNQKWVRIDGFSEASLKYIQELERSES